NLFALMVVWGYPCESKSSPAHYSKHPQLALGVFFYVGKKILKTIKSEGKIKPSDDDGFITA
ncbi:hypothetical protein, partial [Acinetobacter towneri]|uniref:hypothetical protein n=1 Tax=Acinetobacter towneri TaxID=202956 RepID=UPI0020970874